MKDIKRERKEEHFQVSYVKNSNHLEVLVDFEKYEKFKKNQEISIWDVVISEDVFIDQKKGQTFPENELKTLFDTSNKEEILKEIVLKGKCQIPIEHTNKLREEKKKQIVNYISSNSVNPQTKMKYSFDMIENEISKLSVSINPNENFIHQAEKILKKLEEKIPISLKLKTLDIKIPVKYISVFQSRIRSFGIIKKEFYENDGSLKIHLEFLEGRLEEVIEFIKNSSKNECEYHTLEV